MKFLKQVGAAAVALAMLAATAIPAAADESYMKLLTVPVSEVTGYNGYLYNGIGIFNDGSDFRRIDTQQWRESGEISYSEVSLDDELRGIEHLEGFSDMRLNTEDDYAMFASLDENGSISQRLVVKYNGESNSLETVSKYDDWSYATEDGYVVTTDRNEDVCVVQITAPDGTEKSVDLRGCKINDDFCTAEFHVSRHSDSYIVYALNPTSVVKDEERSSEGYGDTYIWELELYGIDRNGNADRLYTTTCNYWNGIETGSNYYAFWTVPRMSNDYTVHVYLSDTDEVVDIDPKEGVTRLYVHDGEGYGAFVLDSLGDRIYSGKAIAYVDGGDKDGATEAYALIDVKTGVNIFPDSAMSSMKYMSTVDGKIYLVQTADDKWGFMNSKGKVLRTYDDAGSFIGDYAPVIKDGKAFLIDRNMKRVSEKIDADNVGTIEDNLFWIGKGDEYYFMTFSNEMATAPAEEPATTPTVTEEPEAPEIITSDKPETTAPEAPAEPAPAESAPTTSGTTSAAANKGNPDTGVAIAFIPLLIAGAGTAVLTRKRK